MKEKAIQIFDENGLDAVAAFLKEAQPKTEAANTFDEVLRHAYWKKNDIDSTVALAQAGTSFCAEQAKTANEEDQEKYLTTIMRISYNLASFVWPGWDEEWLGTISPKYLSLGYEAAKSNLHHATELKKGDLSVSRGNWIVAAHQLAAGDFSGAEKTFNTAAEFAVKAEEKGDELLSKGFISVAKILAEPKNAELLEELEQTKTALKELEHGDFFIKQLDDSLRIFG